MTDPSAPDSSAPDSSAPDSSALGHPDELPDTLDLEEAACWEFLGQRGLGRLAISTDDGVDIFPINYLVHNKNLYFRSAPGTKILELTREPRVAFEADNRTFLAKWSVVIRGLARRLASDSEIRDSGVEWLTPWQRGDKFNYFQIVPERITGRFIRPRT